jgi:predicted DsbA family dithiol-disulfide isomerase
MKAYFTDGLNVGDADVVAKCATEIGLDGSSLRVWLDTDEGKSEVQADLDGAAMREITAVPSFVIDDRFLIPGAQDVDVFVNVLERALTR